MYRTVFKLDSIAKDVVKDVTAKSAGYGAIVASVSAAGVPGLSGAGIMSGLATLGLGSAVVGLGTVALIGSGAAIGVKYLLDEVL